MTSFHKADPKDLPKTRQVVMTADGGEALARARFELASEEFEEAWQGLYGKWLPESGYQPDARPVFDLDSVQLLDMTAGLMAGVDMVGKPLDGAPKFFPGAAANPAAEPFELMFRKVAKKVESGARFFQTQAVFERWALERFSAAMQPLGVPVIAGVLLVRSGNMARFLNDNIPGVQVPDELVERLERASDPVTEGVAIAREAVAWARELCQGVHLMTLGHEDRIPAILA